MGNDFQWHQKPKAGDNHRSNPDDEDLRNLERQLKETPDDELLAFRYRAAQFRLGLLKYVACLWCEGQGYYSLYKDDPSYLTKCYNCGGHGKRTRQQNREGLREISRQIDNLNAYFGESASYYNDYNLSMQGLAYTRQKLHDEQRLMDNESLRRNPEDEELRNLERQVKESPDDEHLAFRYREAQFRTGLVRYVACVWCEGKGFKTVLPGILDPTRCFYCGGHGKRTWAQQEASQEGLRRERASNEEYFGPGGHLESSYRIIVSQLDHREQLLRRERDMMYAAGIANRRNPDRELRQAQKTYQKDPSPENLIRYFALLERLDDAVTMDRILTARVKTLRSASDASPSFFTAPIPVNSWVPESVLHHASYQAGSDSTFDRLWREREFLSTLSINHYCYLNIMAADGYQQKPWVVGVFFEVHNSIQLLPVTREERAALIQQANEELANALNHLPFYCGDKSWVGQPVDVKDSASLDFVGAQQPLNPELLLQIFSS